MVSGTAVKLVTCLSWTDLFGIFCLYVHGVQLLFCVICEAGCLDVRCPIHSHVVLDVTTWIGGSRKNLALVLDRLWKDCCHWMYLVKPSIQDT